MTDTPRRLPAGLNALCGVALILAATDCHRSDTADANQNAEQSFVSVCARCHGTDGKGGVPAAEGANAPRNFCDASFQASRSDADLERAIRQGKGGMPAFGNLFSDADLQALVRKLRSFDPASKNR